MEHLEKTAPVVVALVVAMMEQILTGLAVAEKVALKRPHLLQVAFLEGTAQPFSCSHPHALLSIVNSLLAPVETVLLEEIAEPDLLEELVEAEETQQEIPMQVVVVVMVLLAATAELAVAVQAVAVQAAWLTAFMETTLPQTERVQLLILETEVSQVLAEQKLRVAWQEQMVSEHHPLMLQERLQTALAH
jgi:hypothetical protein